MTEKIGRLGEKYCKDVHSDGSVRYDCAFWRKNLTKDQIKELGLNPKEGMHIPKSELIDPKACDREWYKHFVDKCKGKGYSAYHGTSKENAEKILKEGFEMATGILGRGVYFDGCHTPYSVDVNDHTAVRYAKENEKGTVITTCIPYDLVKTYKHYYKKKWRENAKYSDDYDLVTPEWYDKFRKLQSRTPESLELYFSWHGHKFDSIKELKNAWNEQGDKVRKLALQHGIKVWSDQDNPNIGQFIVYDPEVLENLKLRELISCRTE